MESTCLGLLPYRYIFILSDIKFYLSFYIFKKNRKNIDFLLEKSFPEKPFNARMEISKQFLRHKCDIHYETLYFAGISRDMAKKILKFVNPEIVENYLNQRRNVILMYGKYNNSDFLSHLSLITNYPYYPIFRKERKINQIRILYYVRRKFGSHPVDRASASRQLIGNYIKQFPTLSSFLFDYKPVTEEFRIKNVFLNRDTSWSLGIKLNIWGKVFLCRLNNFSIL